MIMKSNFEEIEPESLTESVFKLIGKDWMLITAGTREHFNTMTASWGGWGVLWERQVCLHPDWGEFKAHNEPDSYVIRSLIGSIDFLSGSETPQATFVWIRWPQS